MDPFLPPRKPLDGMNRLHWISEVVANRRVRTSSLTVGAALCALALSACHTVSVPPLTSGDIVGPWSLVDSGGHTSTVTFEADGTYFIDALPSALWAVHPNVQDVQSWRNPVSSQGDWQLGKSSSESDYRSVLLIGDPPPGLLDTGFTFTVDPAKHEHISYYYGSETDAGPDSDRTLVWRR